ncbi:MAG: nucleotidyltransferase domain-containing protein [Opitutales bacterium]|nr:nucleotidyltransferase domain-containing protein [Opitutales bacterium]
MNQELKDNLIKWAEKRGDIDLMIIFGSRAKGRERSDSDLDLGVWRSSKCSVSFHRSCVEQITDFLPVPIDLIDLSKIDGPLLQEILCNGNKIYQQQDHLLGVLYIRLMDWRTDFMPAWENMLDQRRKRFLAKRTKATISK